MTMLSLCSTVNRGEVSRVKNRCGQYHKHWREMLSCDTHHKSLVLRIRLCTRSISNAVSGLGLFSFRHHFQCQCLVLFSPSWAETMENAGLKSHFTKQECLIFWNVCVCACCVCLFLCAQLCIKWQWFIQLKYCIFPFHFAVFNHYCLSLMLIVLLSQCCFSHGLQWQLFCVFYCQPPCLYSTVALHVLFKKPVDWLQLNALYILHFTDL